MDDYMYMVDLSSAASNYFVYILYSNRERMEFLKHQQVIVLLGLTLNDAGLS